MRLPKRGEKGFTLIELLIVVAILGVLAAVVIPNVTRFVGSGEQEAAETELHNIQLAVTSMMLENGITTIPVPIDEAGTIAENDMTEFPDITTTIPLRVTFATGAGGSEVLGYRLYGHQVIVDLDGDGVFDLAAPEGPDGVTLVNYVVVDTTTYYYTCEADGTVKQWADGAMNPIVWD